MDPLEPAIHTILKRRSDDRETRKTDACCMSACAGVTRPSDPAEEKGGLLNLVMPAW